MFHVFQAGGGLVDVLLAPDLSLERTLYPSRPHLLDVDSPSPGNVTPESSGS